MYCHLSFATVFYRQFYRIGCREGLRSFLLRSEIENRYLVGDVLKVHVHLELFKPPSHLLSQQMESLLDDEKLSDIQVKTKTRSFHASKAILAGTHNNNYEVHIYEKLDLFFYI